MSDDLQLKHIHYFNHNPSVNDQTKLHDVTSFPKEEPGGQQNKGFNQNEGYETEMPPDYDVYETVQDQAASMPTVDIDLAHETNNCCLRKIEATQAALDSFLSNHGNLIKIVIGVILLIAYGCYLTYAMSRGLNSEDQIRLVWITGVVVLCCLISLLNRFFGETFSNRVAAPVSEFVQSKFTFFKWGLIIAFTIFVIVFITLDIGIPNPQNLRSIIGYGVYILLLFLFSTNPSKVKWRPVCWGLAIQFVFALLILRTTWGFEAFKWMGERVSEFLKHSDAGAKFVFGESYEDHFFAFKVLPVVIFFSTFISIMYYLGAMQAVIVKLAGFMQFTMGTTAAESVNAAGNIFIGQTEAPLLIRPFIDAMTPSELHAVMTGGFATIAGSVMATYIMFGVEANHLITASVMAAPCALAMSKLACPETVESESAEKVLMEKAPQRNLIEAASSGASAAISLVANIAANLIAFMALLAFVNATLQWIGSRVGMVAPDYPNLTFQLICSYVLWPFAYVMGVDAPDCQKVAELIGFKTFINEFVAYTELGKIIANRAIFEKYDGPWKWVNGDILLEDTGVTLVGGIIAVRSQVISTYALCGFANISSIGMVLGALGSMSVKQKPVIAQLALRAMITGNIVCFMNACTAGLLYTGNS